MTNANRNRPINVLTDCCAGCDACDLELDDDGYCAPCVASREAE